MSIGVRVSVGILVALVLVCAGVSFWALIQRQALQQQNQGLNNEVSSDESKLADLSSKAKQLQDQADQLNNKIAQAQQDKAQIQNQYDQLKQKSDDLQSQLQQANSDRDDWKSRVDTITRERDGLLDKLKNQPVKIVYKNKIIRVPAAAPAASDMEAASSMSSTQTPAERDEYWASVLRQKAALQIQVQQEKSDLDQAALQVADLKKQNSDLETQVQQISNEKDEIIEKIKYGQDLADNLSIDLARSRNDQQAVNDRADKLKDENLQLLSQVRDLNSIKVDLEKTVARLTDEKDAMQKKLVETESVIQNRIDDIWKIKQSLDKKLAENQAAPNSAEGGMELPPIIVNAPAGAVGPAESAAAPAAAQAPVGGGKNQGTIISINAPNNFIIADLGAENSSVNIGTTLKVYRDSNPIGSLQVIQVRKDICAADIKDHTGDFQVGDVVRFE